MKKDLGYYIALSLGAGFIERKGELICTKCHIAWNKKEDLLKWDARHEHKKWYEFWK